MGLTAHEKCGLSFATLFQPAAAISNFDQKGESMLSLKKIFVSCVLVTALLISPLGALTAHAQQGTADKPNSPEAMTVDLVLVRPLGLVATLAGSLIFVVSWPISALAGNSDEALNSLVKAPAAYTFKRPLGEFD